MAVPNSYLTSTKNLKDILTAIQQAQAPKQFTVNFLQGLGFKSSADRLYIGMLKALGFLTSSGVPTERYFAYLDQTQSARVLAEGVREAYADLFALNTKANEMSNSDVRNKLRTLTQGSFSDAVITKMAATFLALAGEGDFSAPSSSPPLPKESAAEQTPDAPEASSDGEGRLVRPTGPPKLGGLVYNIQIQLPESRDPAVYDALFRSLRTHLLSD